ncbi:MAG: hypothetical protein M1825_004985 [Sarcosagium campestre]|nr:MAG: hypothetical protein M1825_004985 [Sarcosagium campestre]
MSTKHLSNDDFFLRLSELFEIRRQNDSGSIFLSQKRLNPNAEFPAPQPTDPSADPLPNIALPILVRATNGKSKENRKEKIKLSTVVQPHDLDTFYVRYTEVCKSGMQALKKRDRSGRKKAKAKKRKGVTGEGLPDKK